MREELLAHLSREPTDRLLLLVRLGAAFDEYAAKMGYLVDAVAAGKRTDRTDSDTQYLQQIEAHIQGEFLSRMGARPAILAIPRLRMIAFEMRRNGIPHPLFEIATISGKPGPTYLQLQARAYIVRAIAETRRGKKAKNLPDAYQQLETHLAWLRRKPRLARELGGVPTRDSIRGWYTGRRKRSTRFGRFYRLFESMPLDSPEPNDPLAWLLNELSAPDGMAFSADGLVPAAARNTPT
jgi:hypothetical protein